MQLKDHLREMGRMVSGSRNELVSPLGNYYDDNEVVTFVSKTGEMTSIFHEAPVQTGKSQGLPNTWTKPGPRTQVRHSGSPSSPSGVSGGLSWKGGATPRCPRCGGQMLIRGNVLLCEKHTTFLKCPGQRPLP